MNCNFSLQIQKLIVQNSSQFQKPQASINCDPMAHYSIKRKAPIKIKTYRTLFHKLYPRSYVVKKKPPSVRKQPGGIFWLKRFAAANLITKLTRLLTFHLNLLWVQQSSHPVPPLELEVQYQDFATALGLPDPSGLYPVAMLRSRKKIIDYFAFHFLLKLYAPPWNPPPLVPPNPLEIKLDNPESPIIEYELAEQLLIENPLFPPFSPTLQIVSPRRGEAESSHLDTEALVLPPEVIVPPLDSAAPSIPTYEPFPTPTLDFLSPLVYSPLCAPLPRQQLTFKLPESPLESEPLSPSEVIVTPPESPKESDPGASSSSQC